MANQTVTYLAEAKFSGVVVAPENLTIVGIDCPEGDAPDLADPDRIHLPVDDLVASIAQHGVRQAILVRKYGRDPRVFVVAGRRRVRAAREANKLLKDDSKILVRCIPDSYDALASLAIENEYRAENTPMARARLAARMAARGDDDQKICNTLNVSRSGLRVWRDALAAIDAVQQAADQKDIALAVCAEIGKLAPSEQPEALARAIADGRGQVALDNVRAVKRASKEGKPASEAPRRLSAPKIKLFATSLASACAEVGEAVDERGSEAATLHVADAVVQAILGNPAALSPYPSLQQKFSAVLNGEVKA